MSAARGPIMSAGSTLDPDATGAPEAIPAGHDNRALGPSDSSDSGSDVAGSEGRDSDSDRAGTGENAAVGRDPPLDRDRGVDRIVSAEQAGLGDGLDEAEQAEIDPVRPAPGRRFVLAATFFGYP